MCDTAASNAAYFALAAGLAHETKNDTLARQAASAYDVLTKLGLVDAKFNIYDGCQTADDCQNMNRLQISENAGLLLTGAAYMYNQVSPAYVRNACPILSQPTFTVDFAILLLFVCRVT